MSPRAIRVSSGAAVLSSGAAVAAAEAESSWEDCESEDWVVVCGVPVDGSVAEQPARTSAQQVVSSNAVFFMIILHFVASYIQGVFLPLRQQKSTSFQRTFSSG